MPPYKKTKMNNIKKAGDGIRTRDNHLGKVELYQLSYSRIYLRLK